MGWAWDWRYSSRRCSFLVKGQPVEEDLFRCEIELWFLRVDFVVIGNAVVTISRYRHGDGVSVLVVFVVSHLYQRTRSC